MKKRTGQSVNEQQTDTEYVGDLVMEVQLPPEESENVQMNLNPEKVKSNEGSDDSSGGDEPSQPRKYIYIQPICPKACSY